MKTTTMRRMGWIGGVMGLTTALVGCSPEQTAPDAVVGTNDALNSVNGLNSINGLNGLNGLNSINGFNSANGLNSINGLNSANGLMTTDGGRQTVSYLVRCALAAGDSLAKQDQSGNWYTYAGAIGLAPQYKTGSCDANCQEMISSCMLAHVNTSGTHIPLWMVAPMSTIGWGQSPWYPTREGTFFGNIFQPDGSGLLRAHYCTASTVSQDTVPGRLGASQSGAPYTDPYAAPGYCDSSCSMGGTYGNDGASSCPADGRVWSNPLTVWRGQTFQAENASLNGAAKVLGCSTCSNSARVGMIDTVSGVTFNYIRSAAGGSQNIVVYYTNGDFDDHYNRHFNVSVNGGAPQGFAFPVGTYGNWGAVKGMTISLVGFLRGGNNTIKFLANGVNPAPDLDWIEIMPGTGSTVEAETGILGGSTAIVSCTGCSGGARIGYFVQSSSVTLNNVNVSTSGTHNVLIYYSNGPSNGVNYTRSLYVRVNGGTNVLLSNQFPPTGSFSIFGSDTVSLGGFNAGSNNSIVLSTDSGISGPNIDFIQVQ